MINTIFLLSGFIAVISQTFLLREMQLIFHGNELSIGLILSQWMLGVAAGSYLSAILLKKNSNIEEKPLLAVSFISSGIYTLLSFVFIREFRNIFGFFAGLELPFAVLLLFSSAVFIPAGAVIGAQFGIGMRWLSRCDECYKSGRIYLFESLGFFAGGLIYTALLLLNVNSISVTVAIVQLSAVTSVLLFRNSFLKRLLIVLIALLVPVQILSPKLEIMSMSRLYKGYDVVDVKNTPYGQLAVVSRNDERFFFSDGNPIETFNQPNKEVTENSVFLPLLFHPKPENVLLIGGTGRCIPALETYRIRKLDYVELNPWLIEFVSVNSKKPAKEKLKPQIFFPGGLKAQDEGPMVSLGTKAYYQDGRRFVENRIEHYDAVFLDIVYPVSLSLNRFYTQEFFRSVSHVLAPDGIFVISLPGSASYVDKYLGGLTWSIESGLKSSFKFTKVIPGELNVFVCSNFPLSKTKAVRNRFKNLIASAYFLSDKYIEYKLDPAKEQWLNAEIEKNRDVIFGHEMFNTDFNPRALFKGLIYWQSIFSSKTADTYGSLANYIWVVFIVVLLLVLFALPRYSSVGFGTGAAAMGMQMLSIWSVQILNGAVYYWIGFLTACFMAGTGLGTYLTISNSSKGAQAGKFKIANYIKKIELLWIIWIMGWFILLSFVRIPWYLLLFMSAGSGMLLGMQFPLLAPAYAEASAGKPAVHNEASVAGYVYAADLLGGWLAALIGGTIIIPAWGLSGMIIMLLLLKLSTLARSLN